MISRKKAFPLATAFLVAGLVACGGEADDTFETTDQEIITQPGTEEVQVEVPTTDSLLVERTTEIDVDVDTTQLEDGAAPLPPQ